MLIPSNPSILRSGVVRSICACALTDSLLQFSDQSRRSSIDLSKAIKLQDVVFRHYPGVVEWVITALRTITPKHRDLRQISICIPHYLTCPGILANVSRHIGEADYGLWLDLDRFLVQFSESCSIRPEVVCPTERGVEVNIESLFPEVSKRGMIDLVEEP